MKSIAILLLIVCAPVLAQGYVIEYADPADIPYICAARGRMPEVNKGILGCQFWDGKQPRMVIPVGSKGSCIYWHELRHIYEGDWHKGRRSYVDEGCDWRPLGWVE